jgi:hypothetical protein
VVLVEGQEDQGLGAVEPGIVEERLEEVPGPGTSNSDGCIMAVRCHVRSDEDPLRKSIVLKVHVELGKVLDGGETLSIVGNAIVENGGLIQG